MMKILINDGDLEQLPYQPKKMTQPNKQNPLNSLHSPDQYKQKEGLEKILAEFDEKYSSRLPIEQEPSHHPECDGSCVKGLCPIPTPVYLSEEIKSFLGTALEEIYQQGLKDGRKEVMEEVVEKIRNLNLSIKDNAVAVVYKILDELEDFVENTPRLKDKKKL